ncbi:uncharacterized protein LOC119226568 isoform X3 [Pungitius pungitius]|uniref:uncharacterized protein LOC119226568 isoform X3 n=1 Tax=Pungitius pungitius TaxID=134920 RepID=UPI002E140B9E
MVPEPACPRRARDVAEGIRGSDAHNNPKISHYPGPTAKMRFLVPLCVFLAVTAFHSALSASLESAEKDEEVAQDDGMTELKKIDQMEFEAAQKNEAAQMNVTEEQNEETRYLEAAQDGSEEQIDAEDDNTAEGGDNSDAPALEESQSESSEEADEHHEATVPETVSSLDQVSHDSTKWEAGGDLLMLHSNNSPQA